MRCSTDHVPSSNVTVITSIRAKLPQKLVASVMFSRPQLSCLSVHKLVLNELSLCALLRVQGNEVIAGYYTDTSWKQPSSLYRSYQIEVCAGACTNLLYSFLLLFIVRIIVHFFELEVLY